MDPLHNSEPNPRFQKLDKVSLLSLCPLFSGLSQWEMKSIGNLMRLIEFKKGETVYNEGEEPKAFYVVVSGRFQASTFSLNKKRILAYLRRGDYFGEMSLLTHEKHSATLTALSDALLLELKKEDFMKTVEHNAAVSMEISRRLSARLQGGAESRSRLLLKSDVISIFSNHGRIGRTSFSINLAASLFQETGQKTVLLDMSPSGVEISSKLHMAEKIPLSRFDGIESGPPDALTDFLVRHPVGFEVLSVAHQERNALSDSVVIALINHLAIDYRFILIDLPAGLDETVFKSLTQSDHIYFVTDSHINNITEIKDVLADLGKDIPLPEDKIGIIINETLFGIRTTTQARRELFGKKPCYSLPATPERRQHEEMTGTPFVTDNPDAEYSRVVRHIARRISNNLVGIALGSGAAHGLAHVGVLKVLEREKIPIDIISGSSIGALIGAVYALKKNADEVERVALALNSKMKLMRLMDPNLFPVRGLLGGRLIMKHLKADLGDKTFDDCIIPFKATAANLTTRQVIICESGFLLDAVRASIAIPAIFSPLSMAGDTIVDGGILSPLPIHALQQAGANKIIAVNVFPSFKDVLERRILQEEAAEKEAVSMRQKNIFSRAGYRMRKSLSNQFFPNIFDILMNTIQIMEAEIAQIESEAADVVLRPVIPNASWVEFFKPDQFIRRGEEEATRLLPKIKALVSQQNV